MVRLLGAALLGALIALPAVGIAQTQEQPQGKPSDLSDSQRQQLRGEIRAYLLEHPEVILEALQILEQRRAEQALQADRDLIARHHDQIFDDGHSYVAGNPEGDVTLVEFSDYRCQYCKQAHPQLMSLIEADPNLRLVIKEFPILGPDSVKAGRMAIAANALDGSKFGELNDALMAYRGNLSESAAYRIAEEIGYNADALREEAESERTTRKLEDNMRLAQAMGLQGTPSFVLEDEVIRGFLPAQELQRMIAEKRRDARAQSN